MTDLTRHQLDWCAFACRKAIGLGQLVGTRSEPEVRALLQQLEDLLLISDLGSEPSTGAEQLKQADDMVNAAEAAEILGCGTRRVGQLAEALDGRRCVCGCGWVFPRASVIEYARLKGEGDGGD